MSITHTRTCIFTLSMVRIKELFIFSLKKKTDISCFVSGDFVRNPGRVLKKCLPLFPGVPSGLVSLVCSRHWKQYLRMPAYGESEAL